jgi:hypothetical protein
MGQLQYPVGLGKLHEGAERGLYKRPSTDKLTSQISTLYNLQCGV